LEITLTNLTAFHSLVVIDSQHLMQILLHLDNINISGMPVKILNDLVRILLHDQADSLDNAASIFTKFPSFRREFVDVDL
jgi:hypothetical protein